MLRYANSSDRVFIQQLNPHTIDVIIDTGKRQSISLREVWPNFINIMSK